MTKAEFTDRFTLPILWGIVVCTLPHFLNISMWSIFACLGMWGYIYCALRFTWRMPGRIIKLCMTGLFFFVSMTTNEGLTIEAFVSLLSLMICMKLLDVRDQQNRITTIILCYFLIVGSLFFDDSIFSTAYLFFAVLWITAVLIFINQPDNRVGDYLRLSGKLMMQALPVMVLLFMLFPRVQGGMWGRAPIHSAKTGFADRMGFGDIADIAQDTKVAFRVEFDDRIPPVDQLYWRGVVLWEFDGHTWHRGVGRWSATPKRSVAEKKVQYTMTLEPHNERWLITLDLPMRISLRHAWLLEDFSTYRWRPLTQRVSYEGISYLDGRDIVKKSFGRTGLELPEGSNPRTRKLAKELYAQAVDPTDYVNRVLAYFSSQPFVYSLQPPPLVVASDSKGNASRDLVDAFLFDTRKGFCEHFATGFAVLMRAAGVPARIVVGYLGGMLNKYGGYVVVRQSQAHAWCEVWIDDRGWVRIDPTAVVAPARLSGDIAGAVPAEELIGFMAYFRGTPLEPWAEPVVEVLDLINSRWNRWVMGYSVFEQESLFSRIGINLEAGAGPFKAFITTLVTVAIIALIIGFFILYRQKPARDKVSLSWQEFCEKLARIDLQRMPAQGPVDFMHYVVKQRPDLEDNIRDIVNLYIQQRYAAQEGQTKVQLLEKLVKGFHPERASDGN